MKRYTQRGFEFMIGIPGCGKSTYLKQIAHDNVIVVCPDNIRKEVTGNISDISKDSYVWRLVNERVVDALKENKYVILDATNVNGKYRRKFHRTLLKEFPTLDVYAKLFDGDPEVSIYRIKKDIENGIDRSHVPNDVIYRMYDNYVQTLKDIHNEDITLIDENNEVILKVGHLLRLPFGDIGEIISINDKLPWGFPITCKIIHGLLSCNGDIEQYRSDMVHYMSKFEYYNLTIE